MYFEINYLQINIKKNVMYLIVNEPYESYN